MPRKSPYLTTQKRQAHKEPVFAERLFGGRFEEDFSDPEETLLLTSPTEAVAGGVDETGDDEFYFRVNPDGDNFADFDTGASVSVRISLHYLDEGTETITIGYSTNGTSEDATKTLVTKTDTGRWLWAHKKFDARFDHSVYASYDNADFRLYSTAAFYADAARLRANSTQNIVNWKADEFDTNLVDEKANFSGDPDIVGPWTITETYLAYDTDSDATSAGMAPLDYPFFAGATYANRASAPFRVTPAGKMYSTSAEIAHWDIGVVDAYTISADNGKVKLNSQTPYISLGNTVSFAANAPTGKGMIFIKDGGDWDFFAGSKTGSASDSYLWWDGSAGVMWLDGKVVVAGAIRSDDFVAGQKGFRIKGNGNAEFQDGIFRGSLRATTMELGTISATAGSALVALSAGKLDSALTIPNGASADSNMSGAKSGGSTSMTMVVKDPPSTGYLFAVNDILYLKETQGSTSETWLRVISRDGQSDGQQTYTVSYKSGSTNTTFEKGAAVVDFGQSGQGYLFMTADASGAPFYSVRTWTDPGSGARGPWDTANVVERGRFGNLDGAADVIGDFYGFFTGDYANGNYLRYDQFNGFVIKAGDDAIAIDADGFKMPADAATWFGWLDTGSGLFNSVLYADEDVSSGNNMALYIASNINGLKDDGILNIAAHNGNAESAYLYVYAPLVGQPAFNFDTDITGKQIAVRINGDTANDQDLSIGAGSGAGVVPDNFYVTVDKTGAGDHLAAAVLVNFTGSTSADSVQGLEGYVETNHSAGTLTRALGVIGHTDHYGAGTITDAKVFTGSHISRNSSGAITNVYIYKSDGIVRIGTPGTITNGYTFYADALPSSGVTNRWAFYAPGTGDKNYFAGPTGFGTNSITSGYAVEANDSILVNSSGNNDGFNVIFTGSSSASVGPQNSFTVNDGSAMASSDRLGTLLFNGYDSSATQLAAAMIVSTTQAWSTTARGSKIIFYTTPNSTTTLTAALEIQQSSGILVTGQVEIDGDLNHDGSNVGFFGVTPAARVSAYTLTYSTADKTHANFTSTDITSAMPAAAPAGGTGTAAGGWDTAANRNAAITTINGLRTWAIEAEADFEALRVDVADLKQLVNSVIGDLKTYGLFQ